MYNSTDTIPAITKQEAYKVIEIPLNVNFILRFKLWMTLPKICSFVEYSKLRWGLMYSKQTV
jgi:hypothetical protein